MRMYLLDLSERDLLLIIDLQNDFCSGAPWRYPTVAAA